MSRVLVVPLRDGWEASSITTRLVAASVTKAMPATIAEMFSISVHPSEPHHAAAMFSLAPVFFDVGAHSHSVGVNSISPRFIPELDAFWCTRHSNDLANATAFKTNDVQKAVAVIRTALRFFQLFLLASTADGS
jgi:hypothetical protein